MGFLYHAHYVTYFDIARTEMIRSFGLTNRKMEEEGVMLPVLSVNVDYKSPAHYDELLTIKTTLREKPRVKLIFDYEVYNENDELITTGSATLAFMDSKTKRAVRPHRGLMDIINKNWIEE